MRKKTAYKLFLTLFGIMTVVFYDISIPFINFIIQLKINILGFFLEPFLQWAFDITLRQAQVISAWLYLIITSIVCWYLLVKIYQAISVIFYSARLSWQTKNRLQKIRIFLLIVILILILGKTLLMFF